MATVTFVVTGLADEIPHFQPPLSNGYQIVSLIAPCWRLGVGGFVPEIRVDARMPRGWCRMAAAGGLVTLGANADADVHRSTMEQVNN
ncbi:hypothetical protein O7608_09920 [Solwaraspora sp. WMMA2056]|uniref:hypothetical protein n=1 Tax=Solwaraspora sp. WMMA2056 TaxID=3015161 RepID=UPI00259B16CF|nr:hypothetical protein [Solwaraspora sp. WMMA2056]WJK42658.1 hypothetical protein O7608_09920 [Solwaraspora sp. WMMA2056]